MKAADLKYKIEIWRQVINTTEYGRTNITYEYKCQTRARVNYLTGSRMIDNEDIFYSVDREFIVRSYVPVEYSDIIKFDGDEWQVMSIDRIHEYNDIVIKTTRLLQHITPCSPTGVAPTGVAPTGVAPTGVAPTGVAQI